MSHIKPVKPARPLIAARLLPLAALLIMLAALASLTGCGSSTHRYVDNKDVEILESKIRTEGDNLVFYAVMRNSSSSDVNNSVYKVTWFDADGFKLGETVWKPVKVKGGATMYVREVCTTPGAKTGLLELSNDSRKP